MIVHLVFDTATRSDIVHGYLKRIVFIIQRKTLWTGIFISCATSNHSTATLLAVGSSSLSFAEAYFGARIGHAGGPKVDVRRSDVRAIFQLKIIIDDQVRHHELQFVGCKETTRAPGILNRLGNTKRRD
jgi:hypothetical protein